MAANLKKSKKINTIKVISEDEFLALIIKNIAGSHFFLF